MPHRIEMAIICLRLSSVFYLLFSTGFLLMAVLSHMYTDLVICSIIVIVCIALVAGTEFVARGLKRREYWAWVVGLCIFVIYAPFLFLPIGALGLWGLLDRGSRSDFGINTGSGATFDTDIPFDTSAFHTYSIAKLRSDNIELFIDGNLRLTKPMSEFRLTDLGPKTTGAFEQFQGNPKSRTEWDFFRYAIGDDALNLIPVPEPAALSQLVLIGILSLRARRRTH
jgi:hypothetical protein